VSLSRILCTWREGAFLPSKTKEKSSAIAGKTAALPKIAKEVLNQVVAGAAPMAAELLAVLNPARQTTR